MQIGKEEAIAMCKSSGWLVPENCTEEFILDLITNSKRHFMAHHSKVMTKSSLDQRFISAKAIYKALMADATFSLYLPDSYLKDMRPYLLQLVNGLTGGELEQSIKLTMITIGRLQKERAVKKDTALKLNLGDLNEEFQQRLRLQQELY
jgi:hypothetical protein